MKTYLSQGTLGGLDLGTTLVGAGLDFMDGTLVTLEVGTTWKIHEKDEIDIVLEISKCTIVREGLAVIDVTVVRLVVLADLIVLLETLHKFVY